MNAGSGRSEMVVIVATRSLLLATLIRAHAATAIPTVPWKPRTTIGKETYALSKGNSLYFDASIEHLFKNIGKTNAKVLCIATPVVL